MTPSSPPPHRDTLSMSLTTLLLTDGVNSQTSTYFIKQGHLIHSSSLPSETHSPFGLLPPFSPSPLLRSPFLSFSVSHSSSDLFFPSTLTRWTMASTSWLPNPTNTDNFLMFRPKLCPELQIFISNCLPTMATGYLKPRLSWSKRTLDSIQTATATSSLHIKTIFF